MFQARGFGHALSLDAVELEEEIAGLHGTGRNIEGAVAGDIQGARGNQVVDFHGCRGRRLRKVGIVERDLCILICRVYSGVTLIDILAASLAVTDRPPVSERSWKLTLLSAARPAALSSLRKKSEARQEAAEKSKGAVLDMEMAPPQSTSVSFTVERLELDALSSLTVTLANWLLWNSKSAAPLPDTVKAPPRLLSCTTMLGGLLAVAALNFK